MKQRISNTLEQFINENVEYRFIGDDNKPMEPSKEVEKFKIPQDPITVAKVTGHYGKMSTRDYAYVEVTFSNGQVYSLVVDPPKKEKYRVRIDHRTESGQTWQYPIAGDDYLNMMKKYDEDIVYVATLLIAQKFFKMKI